MEFAFGTKLICDNGYTYTVKKSNNEMYDCCLTDELGQVVEYYQNYYLVEAYKEGWRICIGRDENGELEYTLILDIQEVNNE